MRTRVRRLAAPALVALLVLAGCGDDGGDDDADGSTTTEAAGDAGDGATTTTGADVVTITTAGGDDDGTAPSEGDGAGPEDAPPATADPGQDGAGAPDVEAPDVSWDLDASRYRGQDGTRVAHLCPPDGAPGRVWGTGTYTDDSSVCSAAVHAGLINLVEGGRVVIEIAPGEDSYEGTGANGITSEGYGSWPGSFTFPTG